MNKFAVVLLESSETEGGLGTTMKRDMEETCRIAELPNYYYQCHDQ